MKWVVGSIAVLVALVVGIAVGWTMRGRAEPHVHAPPPPPAPSAFPVPPPLPPLPVPSATIAKPPRVWVDDPETFAWPKTASDDVVVVDATHYLVKRAYVDKVLANNELSSPRVIPSVVDGGVVGVKIFGVRAGSAAAKLGLKNGDTIETLNDFPLGSPDDALTAYTHVRDGKKFVLGLERAGAHTDIHYRVLD